MALLTACGFTPTASDQYRGSSLQPTSKHSRQAGDHLKYKLRGTRTSLFQSYSSAYIVPGTQQVLNKYLLNEKKKGDFILSLLGLLV